MRGAGEIPGFLQPLAVLHCTHKLVNTRVSMFIQVPLGHLHSAGWRLHFLMLGCRQDTFAGRGMGAMKIRSAMNCLG